MERVELGFLRILLGMQEHTMTMHVVAEFGKYILHVTWRPQVVRYLQLRHSLLADRSLKQAFRANPTLPRKLSWPVNFTSHSRLYGGSLITATNSHFECSEHV